jgi:hypothetical protein
MNFGVAKFFGAIDKRFQDKYNYLIDLLSTTISALLRKDGGASYPFTAMPYVGTAPIIESGSNANGYYVKYADGTMICRYYVELSATGGIRNDIDWTFPVEFIDMNYSFQSTLSAISATYTFVMNFILDINTSVTQGHIRFWPTVSQTYGFACIAIGRWKA